MTLDTIGTAVIRKEFSDVESVSEFLSSHVWKPVKLVYDMFGKFIHVHSHEEFQYFLLSKTVEHFERNVIVPEWVNRELDPSIANPAGDPICVEIRLMDFW